MRIDPRASTHCAALLHGVSYTASQTVLPTAERCPIAQVPLNSPICVALPDRRLTDACYPPRPPRAPPPPAIGRPGPNLAGCVLLAGPVLLADPHATSVLKTDEEVEGQRPPGAAGSLSKFFESIALFSESSPKGVLPLSPRAGS
jgi:hypothetical protein